MVIFTMNSSGFFLCRPPKQAQQGFTLLELLVSLVIFLMISAGIQMFLVASMVSMNRQSRAEAAEDLGEIVSSQVARDVSNFEVLNSILSQNRSLYMNTPLEIPVVTMTPPPTPPLNASSLMDTSTINFQAKKLPHSEVKLFISPMPEPSGSPSPVMIPSSTQMKVVTQIRWRQTSDSNKYNQRVFTRVLSRDFNSY